MKRIVMVAMLVIACTCTAFTQGIEFFHGTFQEALNKANSENKKLFVDVYTSWCGPCKKMAKTVFTQAKVGEFYNKNFICFKINAEKGEGPQVREKYSVSGYPTLMFLNADNGEVVKKMTAGLDAQMLIEFGKSVLTVNDNFAELKAKYQKNELNKEELYQYLVHLKSRELDKEIKSAFDKYFVMAANDEISESLMNMIPEYTFNSDSEAFQYLVKNRARFNKAIGEEKVTKCISNFYITEFRYKKFKSEEHFRTEKKVLESRVELNKELSLDLDNHFYYLSQNEVKYIETAAQLVKIFEKKKDDIKISHVLGSLKWLKEKESFLKLEKWGLIAVRLNDSFLNNAQMGMVYLALRNEAKANEYFDKAEKIGKENKDPYLQQLPMLKKMGKEMFK